MIITRIPFRVRPAAALAVLLLGPALSGCSEVRSAAGLEKQSPDEFAVLSRAPLSVPPDFGLRPPRPGAERPQEPPKREGARDLLVPRPVVRQGAPEAAETTGASAFKRELGADQANPDIRALINQESATYVYEDEFLVDKLLFWKGREAQGVVVDAAKEQQRLQENAALGKPVTEGETPVIERKRGGLFDDLF